MTIRDYLRRQKARYLGIGTSCLVLAAGLILAHGMSAWAVYSAAAFVFILGYLTCLVLSRSIACPRCKSAVGGYTTWLNLRTSGSVRRMNYCAGCGTSFDEPVIAPRS
ncbi:MAG: hypothetical protein MK141_09605 [Pseudoxanthomonas sp.]|jgi:hypothetical protein|uniref:hypothetical protein n=1 Tax=Pseudoxanthomonas TaxID=83618 RepID=UPI001389CFB0|nr:MULTISPECIES: hypothetical protein [Pseudoxanthomonas]KAF1724194.1 hypothetical protein CSC76_14160 [Pseudoxanthomonas mexicana]MCH2091811.1 hypothetical protein [Pseudoxanthomonas sp.]